MEAGNPSGMEAGKDIRISFYYQNILFYLFSKTFQHKNNMLIQGYPQRMRLLRGIKKNSKNMTI